MDVPFEFKPFEYTPLPSSKSIRLLWLIKRPENHVPYSICGVPLIECRLETVDLNDSLGYNALSYTWGNPKPLKPGSVDEYSPSHRWPIAVNGRLFYVTRNLYELLRRLQSGEVTAPHVDDRLEPYKKTQLIQAAENGHDEQVRNLLSHGASYGCQDIFGETALHYAAENGHAEVVKVLLLHGAQRNVLDMCGRTPLQCCVQRKRGQWHDAERLLVNWEKSNYDEISSAPQADMGLWIDALCINQEDIPERNNQLAMMSQIYGSAWIVLGWLGEADDTTEMARDALTRPWKTTWKKERRIEITVYRKSIDRYFDYLCGKKLDQDATWDEVKISLNELESIRNLLRRSWFSRAWVIQEITLARDIDIYCGPYQFKWNELHLFLQVALGGQLSHSLLADHVLVPHRKSPPLKYWRGGLGTGALSLTDIRLWSRSNTYERLVIEGYTAKRFPGQSHPKKLSLPALLMLSWNFAVSDPRDKVFALLSIATPIDGVVADYSKSTVDIFTQVSKIIVQAEGDNAIQNWRDGGVDDLEALEILSFVRPSPWITSSGQALGNSRPPELPSWVPEFHRPIDTFRVFNKQFNASGDSRAVFYPSPPDILKLDGVLIDEIIQIESTLDQTVEYRLINTALWEWLDVVSHVGATYPTGEGHVPVLLQTLMVGKQSDEKLCKTRCDFKKFVLWSMAEKEKHTKSRSLRLCQIISEMATIDPCSSLRSMENLMGTLSGWLNNRALFRTKRGYLGLASHGTKVNDHVWLLAGGRTPYVLRAVGSSFTFIGEAYVHGIMNGEGLRDIKAAFGPIEIK